MVGVDEAGIVDFKAIRFYEITSLFQGRQDDADMVQPHGMPQFAKLSFFGAHGLYEGIFAAARNGGRRLNVFDEDALVGRRTAEVDDDVVRPLHGFLFQHAARALSFHFFTDAFDVVDFKSDVSDAAAATVELGKDTGVRDNHFNRACIVTEFGEDEVGLVGVDITGIVDFKAIILHELVGFSNVGKTMPT